MGNVIKVLCKVAFYWLKERVLRIKPKLPTFVKMIYIVVEIIGENNMLIMDVFENEIDAKNYCIGIEEYKIIPKNVK